MLEDDISHYSQADICFLPPVSTLLDEDSDDEDSFEKMSDLSGKQLSPPAEVVICTEQEFKSSDDKAELQNDYKKCVFLPKNSQKNTSKPRS